ncbi:Holliday junction resolvase RuvX [Sandaracinobacter sp. RS1-74]|uniref:Holliday junction resolvase RuvX n=1 Tax=Sandaracinobacteroides sayramensis TaxID=2913411 RepID=UPI001EDC17E3|nr:Holliday junction resolvase RuvX [Sandaracinobacteroides sayramensis]
MLTADAQAFAEALPAKGRLLGLDVGTKGIGLATASADWRFATARETLKRGKPSADIEALKTLAEKEGITGLVIGLPLSMDGSDTTRTQSVRAQARNLLKALERPILLWDERWSTVAVERAMIEADVSRAKRAERVDALAAAHILEGALARLAHVAAGG